MGLIKAILDGGIVKAALGGAGGVLADQWREYFYCSALPAEILVTKGEKKVSDRRSANKKGDDNVISNGSIVAVNNGQCMVIVDGGKIVEVCAEPGEFLYDTSSEPSIFYGDLGENIKETFSQIGKRIGFGGDTGKDQRVYFFNTKEIVGNKYGTANAVPFRVVDKNIGLDIDISIRCHGEYSYKIVDPLLFYTNVCGNIDYDYERSEIDSQLKAELMTALQPAFAKISAIGVRYSELPAHTMEMADALNSVLSEKWTKLRGLAVASFGINSVTASEDDEKMIKDLQKRAINRDATMAAATLVEAQAEAMKAAGSNAGGAMTGFMGLGMAQNAGGLDANSLFAMGQKQKAEAPAEPENGWKCECGRVNTGKFCAECGKAKPEPKPAGDAWKCSCGRENTGKFCADCGKPKPTDDGSWICECGAKNKGKFCAECGQKKPAAVAQYKCDKCGWEPKDKTKPPKFCPECGDPFDNDDVVS